MWYTNKIVYFTTCVLLPQSVFSAGREERLDRQSEYLMVLTVWSDDNERSTVSECGANEEAEWSDDHAE